MHGHKSVIIVGAVLIVTRSLLSYLIRCKKEIRQDKSLEMRKNIYQDQVFLRVLNTGALEASIQHLAENLPGSSD